MLNSKSIKVEVSTENEISQQERELAGIISSFFGKISEPTYRELHRSMVEWVYQLHIKNNGEKKTDAIFFINQLDKHMAEKYYSNKVQKSLLGDLINGVNSFIYWGAGETAFQDICEIIKGFALDVTMIGKPSKQSLKHYKLLFPFLFDLAYHSETIYGLQFEERRKEGGVK